MKIDRRHLPPKAAAGIIVLAFALHPLGCGKRKESPDQPPAGGASSTFAVQASADPVPIPNMIRVKAGSFTRMKFPVTISHDYWLGKYEVTQGEFASMMGRNPSFFGGDTNRPVEKVSFLDAAAYCAELTKRERGAGRLPLEFLYRLPSEAEWEYACHAGTTNLYSFGDAIEDASRYAWTAENSEGTTHPVGSKLPNPWGFHDMHGNVWEWCLDWFAPFAATNLVDPAGPPSGQYKVFRGGSWYHDPEFTRCANRFMMSPSNGINFVGFRVALGRELPVNRKL